MRLILALTVLPTVPAAAAINPCFLDQMVAEAVTVIQVTEQQVAGPDDEGICILAGSVVRSFRGTIEPGANVQTTFACTNPENLVGGTTYHDARAVARAGAVELHMSGEGKLAGYGWGLLLVDSPGEAPAFPFEHLTKGGGRC